MESSMRVKIKSTNGAIVSTNWKLISLLYYSKTKLQLFNQVWYVQLI